MSGGPKLSDRAQGHVTRGRPPKTRVIPTTDPTAAPKPAESPKPETTMTSAEIWQKLGPTLKALADPLYLAVGASTLDVNVWTMFCISWGGVVDFYAPHWAGTPWAPAILMTSVVVMPLATALPEFQRRRAAAKRVRAVTRTETSEGGRDGQEAKPNPAA